MARGDFKIIGYLYTQDLAEVDRIQYRRLTHVNYSFVNPGSDGGLTSVDEAVLTRLVRHAHANGVKVGMAAGGWNDGDTRPFEAMASSPEKRARFVADLCALVDRHDLDGVDMDWEYPSAASVDDFEALMRELRAALHPKGKFLSAAVIAKDDEHGRFIRAETFRLVDMLNIMAYDWHYNDNGGQAHSPYSVAEGSLDYWLARGCPREKAILGVPFYGRMPPKRYKELIAEDRGAADRDQAGSIHYNGRPTMRAKTELAFRKGGGIMFWEISQDTSDETSLLTAIHEKAQALKA